jgi:hypothetical protein
LIVFQSFKNVKKSDLCCDWPTRQSVLIPFTEERGGRPWGGVEKTKKSTWGMEGVEKITGDGESA